MTGYDYPCIGDMGLDDTYCPIKEVPFRGVNCSDAAGSEVGFAEVGPIILDAVFVPPPLGSVRLFRLCH